MRGKSIKEIVRELHVSRNTVRKVLRTGATAFSYEGGAAAVADRALAGGPGWAARGNEGKPARERLTLIRIFEELRSQGYEGSYVRYAAMPRSGGGRNRRQ